MIKKPLIKIIIAIIVFLIFLNAGPFFVIKEGEQGIVIRLGKITSVHTDAGLNLKIPFIDEVIRYPKRIMAWEGEARIVPTAEKQYIFVDVVARWRISDPLKFYESIGATESASSKLSEVIDSEVRTVVAENPLRESVRDSNFITTEKTSVNESLGLDIVIDIDINIDALSGIEQNGSDFEPVSKGRRMLAKEILDRSRRMVPNYGIELIDVVTRQISYSPELTTSVYERMKRERNQIAMLYRSEGEGRKAELIGKMENEKMSIRSDAYSQAESVRAQADAEASRIYARAYNQTADRRNFYEFWRAIQSYRETMPNFDKTLTTDMDYFRYLYSTDGRRR